MNDRLFDYIYKAEQTELEDKLRQKVMLKGNHPAREPEYSLFRKGIKRLWLALVFVSGRK